MKKIKHITVVFFLFIIFLTSVKASSYDVLVTPDNIKAKAGDIVEIEIYLNSIDMGQNGVNTLEGYISYDEEVIENIEIVNTNGWKMTCNTEKNNGLYGKFLSIKEDTGVNKEEKIATIKLKIKDKVSKQKSKIEIKEITSNDGESLVNIGNREVNIEFEEVGIVNTGDITLIMIVSVISLVLVLNVLIGKKKIME